MIGDKLVVNGNFSSRGLSKTEEINNKIISEYFGAPYNLLDPSNNEKLELNGKKEFDTKSEIISLISEIKGKSIISHDSIYGDLKNIKPVVVSAKENIYNKFSAIMKWNTSFGNLMEVDKFDYLPEEVDYEGEKYKLHKLSIKYKPVEE